MLGEGGRGAQLPPTGLLLLSNRQRPPQSSLGLSSPAQRQEDLAPQTMQFSFKKLFACYFRRSNCLAEQIEANLRLAKARVGRCEMAKIQGAAVPFSAALGRRHSVAHQFDPELEIAALGEQRPLQETCAAARCGSQPMVPRNATWLNAKAVEYASPIACARDTACPTAVADCSG